MTSKKPLERAPMVEPAPMQAMRSWFTGLILSGGRFSTPYPGILFDALKRSLGMGGIWKPVYLLRGKQEVTPDIVEEVIQRKQEQSP